MDAESDLLLVEPRQGGVHGFDTLVLGMLVRKLQNVCRNMYVFPVITSHVRRPRIRGALPPTYL